MKKSLLILFFAINLIYAQTPCEGGFADGFPCNGIDLMSHLTLSDFSATSVSDSWGWTDATTQKEYAIIGLNNGTAFVDMTDPINPIYLGKLPTHTGNSIWRDIKIYNDYAFIVSEAGGHGMQVFDLTRLRNVINAPETFTEDAYNDSFGNAHNIAINEDTGYAYIIGANSQNGGPIFINIQNPLNPINEGGYAAEGYSHDAQIIIYNGPDTEHQGEEIFVGFNEDSVVIVNVTDKANPFTISELFYANTAYTHQGWFDENHTYLYINDEGDEQNFGFNTRSIVFDATDLDNPVIKTIYNGSTAAIDHNYYVKGNKLYLANYTAGIKVYDISDISNGNMSEIAYFDTYPSNDSATFGGVWNVYPFFESGNIVISDSDTGLYIVRDEPLQVSNLDASVRFVNVELDCGLNTISPQIQVQNFGLTTLTSLSITYTLPDGSSDTINWTGTLTQNETDLVNLSEITLAQGSNSFVVSSSNPNGGTDENTVNDTNTTLINIVENFNTTQVHLELQTDNYGEEISWFFRDVNGNVIASGANYNNNINYTESFNVASNQCYTFEILDGFNDGICCAEGNGFYNLTTDNNTLIATGGDYGAGETKEISINNATAGINDNEFANILIYPNPTKNRLNITSNTIINEVSLYDILGKKVINYKLNETKSVIDISNLYNGVYFLKINDNTKTNKIIKL